MHVTIVIDDNKKIKSPQNLQLEKKSNLLKEQVETSKNNKEHFIEAIHNINDMFGPIEWINYFFQVQDTMDIVWEKAINLEFFVKNTDEIQILHKTVSSVRLKLSHFRKVKCTGSFFLVRRLIIQQ